MSESYEKFGNYILLEKLAQGGMAAVYLAKTVGAEGIGRFVAVKRILEQFSSSNDFISMFKDEAKVAINLSHANVVPIQEFGTEKGQFFLVMEFVAGKNLRQILKQFQSDKKSFSISQAIYICKQVAAGLDHAHKLIDPNTGQHLNIIHRDVSPQNIMVNFEGEVKLVDFGIAKAESQMEKTTAGTLKGKLGYMSPEQAKGKALDHRSDIFSLGAVLWELLTGQRLFSAQTEIEMLNKVAQCQIPDIHELIPNIPDAFSKILYKSLSEHPEDRYQDAAEFMKDLNIYLNTSDPSFNPHDLAQSMQKTYLSEIKALRQKLLSYSNIKAENLQQQDDKTVVLNKPSSPEEVDLQVEALPEGLNIDPNLDTSQLGNVFDEDALEKSMKFTRPEIKTNSSDSFREITRPSFQRQTATNISSVARARSTQDSSSITLLLGAFVLLLLAGAGLWFSDLKCKFLPSLTQCQQDQQSTVTQQDRQPEIDLEAAKMKNQLGQKEQASKAPETLKLSVQTNPSNAWVFIGQKAQGQTPLDIELPSDKTSQLVIRHPPRYKDKQINVDPNSLDSNRIQVELEPEDLAYINLEIRPPLGYFLIDGKKVAKTLLQNYPVIAGNEISIEVVRQTDGKTFPAKKIKLKKDQRWSHIFKIQP